MSRTSKFSDSMADLVRGRLGRWTNGLQDGRAFRDRFYSAVEHWGSGLTQDFLTQEAEHADRCFLSSVASVLFQKLCELI
jgi:hypothetical protein